MSATARAAAPEVSTRSVAVPQQRSAPERSTHLTPLPSPRPRAARGPFVAFIAMILGVGLLALLGLNTVLAQGSFAAYDLRQSTAVLADREQALLQEVASKESPQHLQREAARLGMVPSENPVFLRVSDGSVLGVPKKAAAPVKPKPVVKKSSAAAQPNAAAKKQSQSSASTTTTSTANKQKSNQPTSQGSTR